MSKKSIYLLFLLDLLAACNGDFNSAESQQQAVINGVTDPTQLGFPINSLEQNATLGQLATFAPELSFQGCSGTLVGDRVVISAAHCVVMNRLEWDKGGVDPIVINPDNLQYIVGNDVKNPLCTLQVESIYLNPLLESFEHKFIEHDISISILKESVTKTCPHVVPIPINDEPLTDDMLEKALLQGGFGSTDGTYNFSPIKYWSLVYLAYIYPDRLMIMDNNQGTPTFGDSGSGILYRFPDGSLRNLGILSQHFNIDEYLIMSFTNLANEASFISTVVDKDLLCGEITETGKCVGDFIITCNAKGFRSTDCNAQQMSCQMSQNNQPTCVVPLTTNQND